jgi:hypothetical protein
LLKNDQNNFLTPTLNEGEGARNGRWEVLFFIKVCSRFLWLDVDSGYTNLAGSLSLREKSLIF